MNTQKNTPIYVKELESLNKKINIKHLESLNKNLTKTLTQKGKKKIPITRLWEVKGHHFCHYRLIKLVPKFPSIGAHFSNHNSDEIYFSSLHASHNW